MLSKTEIGTGYSSPPKKTILNHKLSLEQLKSKTNSQHTSIASVYYKFVFNSAL